MHANECDSLRSLGIPSSLEERIRLRDKRTYTGSSITSTRGVGRGGGKEAMGRVYDLWDRYLCSGIVCVHTCTEPVSGREHRTNKYACNREGEEKMKKNK